MKLLLKQHKGILFVFNDRESDHEEICLEANENKQKMLTSFFNFICDKKRPMKKSKSKAT